MPAQAEGVGGWVCAAAKAATSSDGQSDRAKKPGRAADTIVHFGFPLA